MGWITFDFKVIKRNVSVLSLWTNKISFIKSHQEKTKPLSIMFCGKQSRNDPAISLIRQYLSALTQLE